MTVPAAFRWRGGRSLSWQIFSVSLAWLYVVCLHLSNDGLWYIGDAARHAANGLFWWDFLVRFPVNPLEFALRYYARYPVINPTSYPPVFYLLEGTAFHLIAPSPLVGKVLVLAFALATSFYVTAWLRRWISEEAGWGGALLVLQPGIIVWSHAIMLNVPSMALVLAALYHTRRWLETPTSRQIYLTALFTLLGILTYFPSVVVGFVILAWLIVNRRVNILWDRRVLILISLSVMVLLPVVLVVVKWAPVHLDPALYQTEASLWTLSRWTYFGKRLPQLFTAPLLILAGLGIVVGFWDRRYSQEIKLTLVWIIVCYGVFSFIMTGQPRHLLVLGPPFVILSMVGLHLVTRWVAVRLRNDTSPYVCLGTALFLALHVWIAILVRVPSVSGFQEISAFFEDIAPNERIFYDGRHSGVFSFYMLARDQDFKRAVMRGGKLLYVTAISPGYYLDERVSSAREVVEVFRRECGCRWVAIERSERPTGINAARYLRQAVNGPEFEFVRSFSIVTQDAIAVDVYRFLPPIEVPDEVELHLPTLGKGTVFRVRPIR